MNPLKVFYENETEREAVREFMTETLRTLAADRAMEGKPTSGILEARECIDMAFDKMAELYGTVKPANITNSR